MKGIVFTEFLELVENQWGMDMIDDLIDTVQPASNGAYTSVASYDFHELVDLVAELSRRTNIPVPELIYTFGNFLSQSFVKKFPVFFNECQSTFEMLKKVDQHIHVEVLKLYPDAELPKFSYQQNDDTHLTLVYESTRNLPDLAHGLIDGCSEYFHENISVVRENVTDTDTPQEHFHLTLH